MRSLLFFSTFTLATIAASACTKVIQSPTAPSNVVDVRRVAVLDVRCHDEGEGSQCWASAGFTDQTVQDVTGLATWSTSDSSIATVNSTGLVVAHRTGEVAIRAAYQGVQAWVAVWAAPGQGLRGTYRLLTGSVISLAGGGIEGVQIQVVDGPNAGRSTTTYANGVYLMDGLQDGPLVIRFSKPGYIAALANWYIPGSKDHSMALKPVSN